MPWKDWWENGKREGGGGANGQEMPGGGRNGRQPKQWKPITGGLSQRGWTLLLLFLLLPRGFSRADAVHTRLGPPFTTPGFLELSGHLKPGMCQGI